MDEFTHYPDLVTRGCGKRVAGGVYWELGFSDFGRPIESFLIEPKLIDLDALGVTPRGVHLLELHGVWHVLDWVGAMYYPNVTDFIEEARRFGLSRRLELTAEQYNRLTEKSRLLVIHPAAWINNPQAYHDDRIGMRAAWLNEAYEWDLCPLNKPEHAANHLSTKPEAAPHCAGLWWEDVTFGDPIADQPRARRRIMPSFSYLCAAPPAAADGTHQPAIFAAFPLGRIVIIHDPVAATHEIKLLKLAAVRDRFPISVRAK